MKQVRNNTQNYVEIRLKVQYYYFSLILLIYFIFLFHRQEFSVEVSSCGSSLAGKIPKIKFLLVVSMKHREGLENEKSGSNPYPLL